MLQVPGSLIERAQDTLDVFGSPAERRRPAPPWKAGPKPPATCREAFDRLFADAPPPSQPDQISN